MKKMKKSFLLLVSVVLLVANAYSQHIRIGIEGLFDARLANVPLQMISGEGERIQVNSQSDLFWIFRRNAYKGNMGIFIKPHIGLFFMHPQLPVAVRLGCEFENIAFTTKLSNEKFDEHQFYNVKPIMEFRIGFSPWFEHIMTPMVVAGLAYNVPVGYVGLEYGEDKNIANNGLVGEVGIGLFFFPGAKGDSSESNGKVSVSANVGSKRSYGEFSLLYRYSFYNLFNQSYSPVPNVFPFERMTSRYGEIQLRFTVGLFLY